MKTEFKVNDTVRITGNTNGHEFEIGEQKEVLSCQQKDGTYKIGCEKDYWWVKPCDMELVVESTLIPNDLIISAHKEACDKWKGIIEKACPELFKPKFKVGDWVFDKTTDEIKKIGDKVKTDVYKEVGSSCYIDLRPDMDWYRLATPSEVESHLIKVAEEKGYKVGVTIECADYNGRQGRIISDVFRYDEENDDFYIETTSESCSFLSVCKKGKWATIIPSPLELTLEEVAKKFGVSEVKIKQ